MKLTAWEECPECGSLADKHEDNGEPKTSPDYTLRCTECDAQWSPADVESVRKARREARA